MASRGCPRAEHFGSALGLLVVVGDTGQLAGVLPSRLSACSHMRLRALSRARGPSLTESRSVLTHLAPAATSEWSRDSEEPVDDREAEVLR